MVATTERSTARKSKSAAESKGGAEAKSRTSTTRKKTFKTPMPERKPYVLGGSTAKNPHFLVDRNVHAAAAAQANENGHLLSEIMRQGLLQYAEAAAESNENVLEVLPQDALDDLREIWTSNDNVRINGYLAALFQAGWPLRTIAASLAQVSGRGSITRQAVSLRVRKNGEELPEGLPAVPPLPYRRTSDRIVARPKEAVVDASFRMKGEDYDRVAARAKANGAMLSSVVEDVLRRYVDGTFTITVPERNDADSATDAADK